MNNQERTSTLPTILVAILAVFGLATIPQRQGKRPEGTEASAKASVEGAEHKSEVKGPNHLGPLNTLKKYWGNCGPYAGPSWNPSPRREVPEKDLLAETRNLQFLIVLVPDPDGKSMSHVFDSTLSAVLRATESAGYLAGTSWFPWEPPTRDRSKDETKPTHVEATLPGLLSLNVTVGKEEDPKNEDQPGGVLCSRRVYRSNRTENQLLMVLLVPETPTWGVDKPRLGRAFEIVHNYWHGQLHWEPNHAWRTGPIRIVGPNFSGSIPSMVMEMQTWPGPDDTCRPRFVIYNGAALNPQLDVLQEAFPDGQVTQYRSSKEKKTAFAATLGEIANPGIQTGQLFTSPIPSTNGIGQVTFRSTVHNTATLVKTLLEFTLETSIYFSDARPIRLALLRESNTDLGRRFVRGFYILRLMSSLNDVSGIPTEGKNLIIVAAVNSVLHFRIFDGDGKVVVDTDERKLTEQARPIEDLRKQLESLWPPHELTNSEEGRVVPAVTSIVDRTKAKVETRFFERLPSTLVSRFQLDPYVFPMNISRLREEYTARGYYQSNEPIWLSAPERLSLQAMTGKVGDRDLMPYFTPSPTAVEGEMILSQMLQDMERLRYPWIGIVATNPHDQLFLAYKVRQVCPDARLSFTPATSLFTHRDIVPYLRGSLVTSTYPLYLGTQSWTEPMKVPRVGFSYDFTEGIYNATVAHLAELDPNSPSPPAFLDYRFPGGAEESSPLAPPVWISVVGEHGLYPLSVRHPPKDALATPDKEQGTSIGGVYVRKPLSGKVPRPEALRPQLHLSWVVVFLAVSVAGLIGSVYYFWICVAPVAGSGTQGPAWFQVSPALRERFDRPAGHCLATLAVAGGLLLLLLLGLPAWGLARMGYIWPRLDEDGGCLLIGWLALAVGIVAFLVALSRLVRAFIRPAVGRPKYIWWTFASVTLVTLMIVVLGLLVSVNSLLRPAADLRLDCERMTRLSCGVTPMVPVLLLGVAGGMGLIGGWRRLLLFLRLDASMVPGTVPALPDPAAKAAFERVRDDLNTIRDRLRIPLYAASKAGPWWLLLAGVGVLLVWTGLSAIVTPVCLEPRWLQIFFLVALVLGLFLILLTLVELIGVWRMSIQLLRAVAELPMVRAFDRLPTRMVLNPSTRSRDQAVVSRSNPLIDRQIEVLTNGYDRFLTGLKDRGLWRVAPSLGSAPLTSNKLTLDKWWQTIDTVLPVLAYFWMRRSAVTSYATTIGQGSKPPDDVEEWPGLEDRPKDKRNDHGDDQDHDYDETDTGSSGREAIRVGAVATLQRCESAAIPLTHGVLTRRVDIGAVTMMSRCESEKVPAAELRRWLRDAEDLIALVLARQIVWLYANCKSMVTYLVVGLLALTLALTSYPFQPQKFLLTATVLLAAVAAVVVMIAVQANRDEVLSRINKTTPNHFTLDRQFLLTLVTYVVPLLGMFGALSYGMSDVIRSWFEPLFR